MKNQTLLSSIGLFAFCAIAGISFCSTLYFIVLGYHTGPFRDMWIAMDAIRSFFDGQWQWTDFFALHGGAHRLAVPRLFFLVEYGVFSGTNTFLIASSVAIQLSVVYLLWQQVNSGDVLPVAYRYLLTAMSVLLMFNATQLENFLYTFDMQWFLTSASALWAISLWLRVLPALAEKSRVSVFRWLAVVVTTGVSMFSSFSGLCVLLVLPLLGIAFRLKRTTLFCLVLVVAAVVAAYLHGPFAAGNRWSTDVASITPSAYLAYLFSLALRLLKWTALYLGSPLSREFFWPGALFAYTSLLFLLWQWLKALRFGANLFNSFQLFCLSVALFAAIVAIATGLGRMYFVNTADEDRYQSIVLVYWLGIFAFALTWALSSALLTRCVLGLVVFWTCVVIPVASVKDARAQLNFFNRVNNANLAIAAGQLEYSEIKDTLILGDRWKKTNRPEMHDAFLRARNWGVFADEKTLWLGKPVDASRISGSCSGDVLSVAGVAAPYQGYRVVGLAMDDNSQHGLLRRYVLVDERDIVVGLGRLQRQKDSLLPVRWQAPAGAQWLAYTTAVPPEGIIRILGLRDDGSFCAGNSAKLPRPLR